MIKDSTTQYIVYGTTTALEILHQKIQNSIKSASRWSHEKQAIISHKLASSNL